MRASSIQGLSSSPPILGDQLAGRMSTGRLIYLPGRVDGAVAQAIDQGIDLLPDEIIAVLRNNSFYLATEILEGLLYLLARLS